LLKNHCCFPAQLFVCAFLIQFQLTVKAVDFDVSTPQQLSNALSAASAGDRIVLSNGDYGQLDIHNRNYSSYITLLPATANNDVRFSNIEFQNASYVRLSNLTIISEGREGIGIFSGSHHIQVLDTEIYGMNQFDRSAPHFSQAANLYGINTNGNVHNLLIENIDAHDFLSSAYLFTGISDSIIRGNRCDWVASDCYKFAGADGILFENNFGAGNIYSAPDAHVDFVQGQGAVSNSIFRGNVALMNTRTFQGLFFDDATYTNLTFENNLISTANNRGISVSGELSSGIVARYNTVLRTGGSQKATFISLPPGSTKEFNIETNNTTKNGNRFPGTNIVTQWDDQDDIAHYDLYYTNADRGPGAIIQDFTPVAGSPAFNTVGAFERIHELLLNGSSPQSGDRNFFAIPPVLHLLLDSSQ